MNQVSQTVCPLDCPDACLLDVTVRDGRVEQIDGSHENPVTAGFICSKVRGFTRRLYGDVRLEHPLRRVGAKGDGSFEVIPWDEAIRDITERLRAICGKWGGEAILPYHYGGSNGLVTEWFPISCSLRDWVRLG